MIEGRDRRQDQEGIMPAGSNWNRGRVKNGAVNVRNEEGEPSRRRVGIPVDPATEGRELCRLAEAGAPRGVQSAVRASTSIKTTA